MRHPLPPTANAVTLAQEPTLELRPQTLALRSSASAVPALAAVALLAWLLDWRAFGPSELGQDGFLSVDLGFSHLASMLTFTVQDVHPPLFYTILHIWFFLVGTTYFTAKYIVITSGILSLVVLGRLGARLAGPATSTLATLLLALSPTFVRLSTTVRDFVPGIFFSLVTLLLTAQLLGGAKPHRHPIAAACLLALATAAGLLTSYFHLAILLTEACIGLVVWRRQRFRPARGGAAVPDDVSVADKNGKPGWRLTLWGLIAGTVLALPWYLYFVPHLFAKFSGGITGYTSTPKPPALPALTDAVAIALVGRTGGALDILAAAGWFVALGLGVLALWRHARSLPLTATDRQTERAIPPPIRQMTGALVGGSLIGGLLEVALLLWRWQLPTSLTTYVVVLLPLVALLQALALTRGRTGIRMFAALTVLLTVIGQLSWYRTLVQSVPIDWTRDKPLNYLAVHVRSGDGLIFSDHARRAQYILASNWTALPPLPRSAGTLSAWPSLTNGGCNHGVACAVIMTSDVSELYLHATPAEARQIVAGIVRRVGRIWFAESGEAAGVAPIGRAALASESYFTWSQSMDHTLLQLFTAGHPDARWSGATVLGSAVRLQSASFTSHTTPGGTVLVQLVWRDLRPMVAAYTVFVHLDAVSGHLVAQQDGTPVAGLRLTTQWQAGDLIDDRHGVVLPASVPPGQYRLHVGLYQGQQRLALPDGTNQISLGQVQVGQ